DFGEDEEYFKEEAQEEQFLDELDTMKDEQREQMELGVASVKRKLGGEYEIKDIEIKNALWYYYFDEDEAIRWLKKNHPKKRTGEFLGDVGDVQTGISGEADRNGPLLLSRHPLAAGVPSLPASQGSGACAGASLSGLAARARNSNGETASSLSRLALDTNGTFKSRPLEVGSTSSSVSGLGRNLLPPRPAFGTPAGSLAHSASPRGTFGAGTDNGGNSLISNALRALKARPADPPSVRPGGPSLLSPAVHSSELRPITARSSLAPVIPRPPISIRPQPQVVPMTRVSNPSKTVRPSSMPEITVGRAGPSDFAQFIFADMNPAEQAVTRAGHVLGTLNADLTTLGPRRRFQSLSSHPTLMPNSKCQVAAADSDRIPAYRQHLNLLLLCAVGKSGTQTPKGGQPAKVAHQAKAGGSGSGDAKLKPFAFDKPSPDDIVLSAQSRAGGQQQQQQQRKAAVATPRSKAGDSGGVGKTKAEAQKDEGALERSISELSLEPEAPSLGLQAPSTQLRRRPLSERNSEKDQRLNLIIVGHVDAGKSTLMGHLLSLLREIDERTMRKYMRESEQIGKGSFAFAWALDSTEEERERGVTIDIATSTFETKRRKFLLLDAPGHRDFVPNMIAGAARADVAILVVDATPGSFEAGFDGRGQTREHAMLVRSLGVRQLIVAVNKMDAVGWAEKRFGEIRSRLSDFLAITGFTKGLVKYVPVSGIEGVNLAKRPDPASHPELCAWYNDGPSLVELLDELEPPERPVDKAFRLPANDYFRGGPFASGKGKVVTVTGTIAQGVVSVGEQVVVMPIGENGVVKAIDVNSESVDWAMAGENVMLTIDGIDIQRLSPGALVCPANSPVAATQRFGAQIVVFATPVPITSGFPVILHVQSINEPAYITKL
ncbi:hypothetical protein EV182_002566, partial [Spiromyces aspiralis]